MVAGKIFGFCRCGSPMIRIVDRETHSALGRNRLGPQVRVEVISPIGLYRNIFKGILQTEIGTPAEIQPHGASAASRRRGVKINRGPKRIIPAPAQPSICKVTCKVPIPNQRAVFRPFIWKASRFESLAPNPASISRPVFANQFVEKRKRSRQCYRLPERHQSLPDLESGLPFMNGCEKINRLEISIYVGGKHLIQQRVYIMTGAPCSRNCQSQERRVRSDG